jgi:hypothetical protein
MTFLITQKKQDQRYVENAKIILVPIDGQLQSLKAPNGAVSLSKDVAKTRTFLLNVIECTDDEDESLDGEMTSTIEDEARRMLRSIDISIKKGDHRRNCKNW